MLNINRKKSSYMINYVMQLRNHIKFMKRYANNFSDLKQNKS